MTMPANVSDVFATMPEPARRVLMDVRDRIFAIAAETEVGPLTETLKWGQPSYLTEATKAGTTLRLGLTKGGQAAVFFTCHTRLVDGFRADFPDALTYLGNRGIQLDASVDWPALDHCLARALTYHRAKRKSVA